MANAILGVEKLTCITQRNLRIAIKTDLAFSHVAVRGWNWTLRLSKTSVFQTPQLSTAHRAVATTGSYKVKLISGLSVTSVV